MSWDLLKDAGFAVHGQRLRCGKAAEPERTTCPRSVTHGSVSCPFTLLTLMAPVGYAKQQGLPSSFGLYVLRSTAQPWAVLTLSRTLWCHAESSLLLHTCAFHRDCTQSCHLCFGTCGHLPSLHLSPFWAAPLLQPVAQGLQPRSPPEPSRWHGVLVNCYSVYQWWLSGNTA